MFYKEQNKTYQLTQTPANLYEKKQKLYKKKQSAP